MPRFRIDDREKGLADTRRKLLEAAVLEFSKKGFELANINTISEAAGLGKGTVYNYFPSKKDLMLAAITSVSDHHRDYIREQVLAAGDPLARLKAFYAAGFTFVEEFPGQANFMISTMFGTNPDFKAAIYRQYIWMAALIRGEILDCGKKNGFFTSVDPQKTTGLLMTMYLGTCSVLDENGKVYMNADDVCTFILRSIQGKE